ncbi:MAG: Uma2 family endonuclease [Planctomycetes bacterium]|nr:Uma2 family endonuclease [Planctomycetota bacterium]
MNATATVLHAPPMEDRILLHNIPWEVYEALRGCPRNRSIRFTYDRGRLELMSPSARHERLGSLAARFVQTWTLELNIPILSCGSMTLKRAILQRGLESDKCFYIQNEALVREREDIDLDVDPLPDLGIEIDITASSIERFPIYAALRVPELWHHDGETLRFYALGDDGQYHEIAHSIAFPQLTPQMLMDFLDRQYEVDETTLLRQFSQWVRETFLSDANSSGVPG